MSSHLGCNCLYSSVTRGVSRGVLGCWLPGPLIHKVPPNKTDQVQPVDRGLGRHIKLYLGQEMDAWLDDDDNLDKCGLPRAYV